MTTISRISTEYLFRQPSNTRRGGIKNLIGVGFNLVHKEESRGSSRGTLSLQVAM